MYYFFSYAFYKLIDIQKEGLYFQPINIKIPYLNVLLQ
jgi:hypothetical protein